METRALNVCQSGPLLKHAKDSEEDETPVRTQEEGACRSAEAWREPFIPPNCIREFESIFAKEDFDILPEHR